MLFIISLLTSLLLVLIYFALYRSNLNVVNVAIALIAFIPPFIGPTMMIVWIFISGGIVCTKSEHEIEYDIYYNNAALYLQDSPLAHWLFNTVDPRLFWKEDETQTINENKK